MIDTLDSSALPTQRRPAGFWIRLVAAIIDFFVLLPVVAAALYFTIYNQNFLLAALVYLIGAAYKPMMEHLYGGTVGKLMCKIQVIDEDGSYLSVQEAWVRYLPWLVGTLLGIYLTYRMMNMQEYEEVDGFLEYSAFTQTNSEVKFLASIQQFLSFLPLLSAFVMFFNKPKQAAHDILANSYVVYSDKP